MFRVLIVSSDTKRIEELSSELSERGLICSVAPCSEEGNEALPGREADLALVAIDGIPPDSKIWGLAIKIKRQWQRPVIALIPRSSLSTLDSSEGIDDFVIEPWDATEIIARSKRILHLGHNADRADLIQCGDLTIDPERCEVSVGVRKIELTYREYELLRFLTSNKGRVFTREALLNRVWGYDYFGGDRTVDVHIRRLRSKIEDPKHTFIETVRNIGYRVTK